MLFRSDDDAAEAAGGGGVAEEDANDTEAAVGAIEAKEEERAERAMEGTEAGAPAPPFFVMCKHSKSPNTKESSASSRWTAVGSAGCLEDLKKSVVSFQGTKWRGS